jgi:hypothetical protein
MVNPFDISEDAAESQRIERALSIHQEADAGNRTSSTSPPFRLLQNYYSVLVLLVGRGLKTAEMNPASWLIPNELAERGGFEPPVPVLASTTV